MANQKTLSIPHADMMVSAIDFVEQMLAQAIGLRASDVHIELYRSCARLRYRLDGMLNTVAAGDFLFNEYAAVATRVKVLAELDIAEHRLPQDGRFSFACEFGKVDIRVAILPAVDGERLVLRIMEASEAGHSFSALGMNAAQVERAERVLNANQGMILVTGPTGSGKTTTLYTMLSKLNRETANILTVENPVEKRIDGVGQVQVCEEIGLDFSNVLRAFLRQDPEVIMLGEIRDFQTADIAVKAALTGHLVMSTVHTNDAASTVARLIGLGLSPPLIGAALNLIVSQRLVRLICKHCKTRDTVSAENLETPDGVGNVELFRGAGCAECACTGYQGRQGVYEMLEVGADLRRVMMKHDTVCLETEQNNDGELKLAGYDLLVEGKISFAEYQRVFGYAR